MRQMSKAETFLFLLGGLLMVVGAGCFAFMWHREVASWIFLVGAVLFSAMQTRQTYSGTSLVIRRLKRIQLLSGILFILTGILMADTAVHFLLPLFKGEGGYISYITYIYNKWVIALLIAAVLEVYTTHRLSHELEKEKKL
ncbi:MAG: hypothetical protein PUG09_02135 [Prevotella sp.]|nr:hypothetical protein [Prevotella sp.]